MKQFQATSLLESLSKVKLEGEAQEFYQQLKQRRKEYEDNQNNPVILIIGLEIFDEGVTINGQDFIFSGSIELKEGESYSSAFHRYLDTLIIRCDENNMAKENILKTLKSYNHLDSELKYYGEALIDDGYVEADIRVKGSHLENTIEIFIDK